MALPKHVIQFAQGNTTIYEAMKDYYFHALAEDGEEVHFSYDKTKTLAEKDKIMHKALFSEIGRISNQPMPEGISVEQWAGNPNFVWATFATVNMLIDSIIPDTLIKDIGRYTDIRTVGFGETATFDIVPNSLFTTSRGSNARRTTFVQKQFKTSKTLVPENHAITVETSLYRMLSGEESIAEFVRKAVISMQRDMLFNAYDALNALVENAKFPQALKKAGYDKAKLLNLCEVVTAYNKGKKAVIMGTASALSKILPEASEGYRVIMNSDNMSIQLIKNVFGYDVIVMPQVATGHNFELKLDDDKIYVLAPTSDKLIKGAIEGTTLTQHVDYNDNANLTATATFNKRYIFEAVTNATCGVIELG